MKMTSILGISKEYKECLGGRVRNLYAKAFSALPAFFEFFWVDGFGGSALFGVFVVGGFDAKTFCTSL